MRMSEPLWLSLKDNLPPNELEYSKDPEERYQEFKDYFVERKNRKK